MGVREETVALLKAGHTPGAISALRRVTLETTLGYLDQMIGCGRLRRSDILFSIPRDVRQAAAMSPDDRPEHVSRDDWQVVKKYGDAAHALGDMYEDLRATEVRLHEAIKVVLVHCLGEGEAGWWRQGIPEQIRKSCTARREEDADPAETPYAYTDLVDLGRIMEANWQHFSKVLPTKYATNRKLLLDDLRRMNGVRRNVMHPVRGMVPSEDDFEFIRAVKDCFIPENPAESEFLRNVRTLLGLG